MFKQVIAVGEVVYFSSTPASHCPKDTPLPSREVAISFLSIGDVGC
jgi:hypothetical protein